MQASDQPGGMSGFQLFADGTGWEGIILPAGGSACPATPQTVAEGKHFVHMAGKDVYRYATRQLAESALAAVRDAGLTMEDIDQFVFHQANLRIIEHVAKQLEMPMEKTYVNIEKYGNTSAASVPMALVEAVASGRIKPGDRILMCAFGAGFTAAAAVVEWTADPARAFLAPGSQTRMGQPQRTLEPVAAPA
jgi:3-oxoacyl-[acyl-carrier-protein] synthase-3